MPTEMENPLHKLTPEQIEAIGKEFDALHEEVFEDLGDRDARYIRSMIELHRRLALLGRVLLVGSRFKPLWAAGTATLSLAKILENMEIGHNVMHGQWDWMNDPVINSAAWDWDSASTPGGVEALPQLRAPHLHEHPRQGQGPRLRDHADRPAPAVASGLPRPADLQRHPGGAVRVGGRLPRPRLRRAPQRREVQGGGAAPAQGHGRQGALADRQGLRRVPAAQLAADGLRRPQRSASSRELDAGRVRRAVDTVRRRGRRCAPSTRR